MKKTLSLLLVLAMVLSSFGFAFAAKDEVKPAEFLNEKGILKGNASGDLMLEDNLKRQDMIVMLSRLLGVEKEAKAYEGETSFKDVVDPFYVPYVAWAEANELTNGKAEGKFGFDEFVTEQQVAQFMLRALGYGEVAWDEVPAKAVALKLVEKDTDLSVDAKRSVLAEITYKALGTKMKDSDKTLAEFLKIEMPAPGELKVEKVYTENLREVVVELSNAKLVNEEKLADANNYKLVGNVVQKATVEGNTVTVLLKDALTKDKDYEFIIRGIDKAINGKHDFTAKDNTIPAVENVEVLGEYGIKVTTTEPIKDIRERNFLVDGKNIAMEVEQYGRNIILTPYHKASFPENAEKLTVKGLEDYAGYKSVQEDFEIKIAKDEVAPKVVDVIARGNKVEVVFDKDVYKDSVEGYYSRVSVGNISYEAGRHPVYAGEGDNDAIKIDTNRVLYTFKDELPRRTVVTIVDVMNHSKVAMEKTTMEARVVVDDSEPEIIDKEVYTKPAGTATIVLYFDKDVEGKFLNIKKDEFDPEAHFTLYEREVLKRNIIEDKVVSAKYDDDRKDVIVVKLEGLKVNNKDKDYNYILEVVDFVDIASSRNKMYRDYVDFDVKAAGTDFTVKDVTVVVGKAKTEITILFNKYVDRTIAEDPTNYIFLCGNGKKYDVKELDGQIETEYNGKKVTLILPEFDPGDFVNLRILDSLKDKDGNRLDAIATYVFGENYSALVERAKDAENKANKLLVGGATTDNEKALKKELDVLVGLKDSKTGYKLVDHDKLVKAIEKVEEAIEKVEKDNKGDVATAKKALGKLVAEAEEVYKNATNVTDGGTSKTALGAAITNAKFAIDSDKATLTNVNNSKAALETAIGNATAATNLTIEKAGTVDLNGKTYASIKIDTDASGTITLKKGTVTGNLVIDAKNAHVVLADDFTVNGDVKINAVAPNSFVNNGTIKGDIVVKTAEPIKITTGDNFEGVVKNGTENEINVTVNEKAVTIPANGDLEAKTVAKVTYATYADNKVTIDFEVKDYGKAKDDVKKDDVTVKVGETDVAILENSFLRRENGKYTVEVTATEAMLTEGVANKEVFIIEIK